MPLASAGAKEDRFDILSTNFYYLLRMLDCARDFSDEVQQMQRDGIPPAEVTAFIESMTDASAGYPTMKCAGCVIELFFEKRPYGPEPPAYWRPILDLTGVECDVEEMCIRSAPIDDGSNAAQVELVTPVAINSFQA